MIPELNAYRTPSGLAWRDTAGNPAARIELATNEAPVLDAANPWGFAACAVLAAVWDLYPAATVDN